MENINSHIPPIKSHTKRIKNNINTSIIISKQTPTNLILKKDKSDMILACSRRFKKKFQNILPRIFPKINPLVEQHTCGLMNIFCQFCQSLNFLAERPSDGRFTHCCHKGKVKITQSPYPDYLKNLLSNSLDPLHKNFMHHIRSYNSVIAFASMEHKFQNYQAIAGRLQHPANSDCDINIMRHLDELIRQINPYALSFKTLGEVEKAELSLAEHSNILLPKINMIFRGDRSSDRRRYNFPTIDDVAMIFTNDDGEPPFKRDIKVYPRSNGNNLVILNVLSPNLDPMVYPVLFPHGDPGWQPNMIAEGFENSGRSKISMLQFKIARLAVRQNIFNPLLNAGRLTQQYIVDSYLQVEANNLNFIKFNQSKLRVEEYSGLMNYLASDFSNNIYIPIGRAVILPSSFQGSHRNMQERYHDAMSIVLKYGKPDLFITFTCNPTWPEISENLFNGQTPADRPDIVSRVFKIKLAAFLSDITKNNMFGKKLAYVYTIEFQKRGLPHAHLLFIISSEHKIDTAEAIDKFVYAERPDRTNNSQLFNIVTRFMIHGPCGILNPRSPCMDNGVCTKNFPKDFINDTITNTNGYPLYKRRDVGFILISGKPVDNRFVIPYNTYLLLKYNAHINVEICTSV
ncbi:uncharacterized protein LOC135929885 [Gordionus sp. m RMFG-2023]|uniref:uncharacterized protein LOC135929885 n=1 Tax=Gordionus sp. m RMFG-2023 TaxID=3053472 RepID=UPI0031FD0BCF